MAITSIEVHVIIRRTGTSFGTWAGVCRYPKTGGSYYLYWDEWPADEYGPCHFFTESTYTEHYGIFYTDPITGVAWTVAGINEKSWGMTLNAGCSGTGATRCTQMWLVVNQTISPASYIMRPAVNTVGYDPAKVLTNDGDATYESYTTPCIPFLGCDYNGAWFTYGMAREILHKGNINIDQLIFQHAERIRK